MISNWTLVYLFLIMASIAVVTAVSIALFIVAVGAVMYGIQKLWEFLWRA